jgi:hypothetical protein
VIAAVGQDCPPWSSGMAAPKLAIRSREGARPVNFRDADQPLDGTIFALKIFH